MHVLEAERGKECETENNKTEEKNSMCKCVGERQGRGERRLLYMVISCLHYMPMVCLPSQNIL